MISNKQNWISYFIVTLSAMLAVITLLFPPVKAVLLCVALIVSLSILKWPFAGLLLMVALIPLQVLVVMPGGRTILYPIGILTAFGLIIKILLQKIKIRINKKLTFLILAFFIWGVTSITWAEYPDEVILRTGQMFNLMIFFIIFQILVERRIQIIWLITAFVAATGIGTVIAKFITGFGEGVSRLELAEADDPNNFAGIIGMTIIFLITVIFPWIKKFPIRKWIIMSTTLPWFIIAFLATGSRGAVTAMLISILTYLLLTRKKIKTVIIGSAVIATLLLIVPLVIKYNMLSPSVLNRYKTMYSPNEKHFGGRLPILFVGMTMIKENFFRGVGWRNFYRVSPDYNQRTRFWGGYNYLDTVLQKNKQFVNMGPHNIYLGIQAELGIMGSIIFIAFLWGSLKGLYDNRTHQLAMAVFITLFFLLTLGLSLTVTYKKFFWFALSLATALPKTLRLENSNEGKLNVSDY